VYQDIAGRPSKSGDGGALARGYIGEAIDDYQQQIAVVVDPRLVDMRALQVELTDAIAAAHRKDPKVGPLSIHVQAACHSAPELIEARDVVQALAWHPDANAAVTAWMLWAPNSTYQVWIDPAHPDVGEALQRRLGDRVSVLYRKVG
jgi:hypothetical protein